MKGSRSHIFPQQTQRKAVSVSPWSLALFLYLSLCVNNRPALHSIYKLPSLENSQPGMVTYACNSRQEGLEFEASPRQQGSETLSQKQKPGLVCGSSGTDLPNMCEALGPISRPVKKEGKMSFESPQLSQCPCVLPVFG
jgi:hypothetical protein